MMVKCNNILYTIVSITTAFFVRSVGPCVATEGGTTVTTTTTTTTVSPTGCNTCTQGQITFLQDDGALQIDSSGVFSTDPATGCLSLVATCTADVGFTAFMQFNINQGGPAENQNAGRTINAPLACVNGQWIYTSGGVSRVVTTVSCNQAPDAG